MVTTFQGTIPDNMQPLVQVPPAGAHPAPRACGRGKHERAAECFRAALALRSGEARSLFKLGNACFALQRFAAAEDAFEQALRVRAATHSHADTALS